jgi:hypothetical protein
MTERITFDTQLREMCDRYGFTVQYSFVSNWAVFFHEGRRYTYRGYFWKNLYMFIRDVVGVEVDFFEWYQIPPPEVREIMGEHIKDGMSYDECSEFRDELEAVGWRFDYGLDAEPYNLRPIL